MLYNVQKNLIDGRGYQYICGMLEKPKFNDRGLWHNIKAFDILLNHKQQKTTVSLFYWIDGVARDFKIVKVFENEIIDETEIKRVLAELNLLSD